ncbi:transporter substrate-binding domain-containing protein [Actinosynnema sp. NPDC023794]
MKRLLLALLLLAGCAAQPAQPAERTAEPVLPNGYRDPGQPASLPPECTTQEGRAKYDPTRTLNPAGGLSDGTSVLDGGTLAEIRENGLDVGVSQTTPLLSRRDQVTGEMEGFEIDLINRIATELFGRPLQRNDPMLRLVTMPTGSRLLALDTDKNNATREADQALEEVPVVDMVVADVTMTCDRVYNHDVVYSTPYLTTNAGLLTRSGTEARDSLDELRGRKVCAASATTSIVDLLESQRTTGVEPVSTPDSSECLMLLQRGLVDAVYTDFPILQGLQMQDPGTELTDLPGQGGGTAGVAISAKHKDLVRFVNGVIARMRADGSLQASHEKWFGEHVRALGLEQGPVLPLPPITYID